VGDVRPGGRGRQGCQQRGELVGVQAARVRTVDGREMLGIEHVDVHVQPVPARVRREGDRPGHTYGCPHPARPDLPYRKHRSEGLSRLGQVRVVLAATEVGDVARCDIRAESVQIGHAWPVPADRGGQVLASEARARVVVTRMTEVGVPVQVHQAVPPTAGQRQPDTDTHAAVPTEDERSLSGLEQRPDAAREAARVVDQRVLVAHASGSRVGVADIPAGQHHTGVDRPRSREATVQTGQLAGAPDRADRAGQVERSRSPRI